jgi:threonyl-tRNA synthetase
MSMVDTQINVKLPDGSQKSMNFGETVADLAKSISQGLYRNAVGALINNELLDLYTPLNDGDSVKILTAKDPEAIELLRHSTAHVMAQAVQKLFPKAKIAIGPTIDDGFYYDFEIEDHALTLEDLAKIEGEMKKIAESNQRLVRFNIPDVDKQLAEFASQGEKFKAELFERAPRSQSHSLSDARQGGQYNLERSLPRAAPAFDKPYQVLQTASKSPAHTGAATSTAGRICNASMPPVSGRINRTSRTICKRLEEAEKRDHRKLSKELDLFSTHDEVGPGPDFLASQSGHRAEPLHRKLLAGHEHRKRGYQFVYTPHIANEESLCKISGHLENYAENMYSPMDIDGHALPLPSR